MKLQAAINTSLAFLIISASGLAAAGPEKKDKSDKDILRGPNVVTTSPAEPGDSKDAMNDKSDRSSNSDQMARQNQQANRPILTREYFGALRQLSNSDKAESFNLTEDQQNQLRTIMADHREAMREFQEANRDRIRALREKAQAQSQPNQSQRDGSDIVSSDQREERGQADRRSNRQGGERGQRANSQDNPQGAPQNNRAAQMREKIRNFMDNAPPNKEALSKMKQVLTVSQMEILKTQVHKSRAQRVTNTQRPGGADRQRGPESESDRPNVQRRRINRDSVENSGDKESPRGKRSRNGNQSDKPTADDD